MEEIKKILGHQMELIAEKSKDCPPVELAKLSDSLTSMSNLYYQICLFPRNEAFQACGPQED